MNYSREIAPLGHTSTHVPHSVQRSASITATSFSSIAPTGHSSTHVPHAVQSSASTTAGIFHHQAKQIQIEFNFFHLLRSELITFAARTSVIYLLIPSYIMNYIMGAVERSRQYYDERLYTCLEPSDF